MAWEHLSSRLQRLVREHLLQNGKNFRAGLFADFPQLSCQPDRVYCPQLIKNHLSRFALELAGYSRRVLSAFCCHRGYDHGPDVMIHLVRRNN
jgi:hypothetical protein